MADTKSELKNYQENKLIRSFGRIKSRKLSDRKNNLYDNLLPSYKIDFSNLQSDKKNILEIGFGFGDFSYATASNNPDSNFYGFEPHINGVVNLLQFLEKNPLQNIKISDDDVRQNLDKFPNNFFDQIYILFPDPWPKFKHYKRRLINVEFLDKILAPKMKKDSKLIIATDHDSYKRWIFSQILLSKKFRWLAKSKSNWQNFPKDWTFTKYQKKAQREGRVSIIINLECL
ncbi:MAG: tRNA (guanosine(46)-N7)-methyltransferase TrmB [Rickettsiales bacterium]|nr:tRNA (guanosine(46)-N7)-methyltransferase TrmB [Rickettsiales bacterium]